MSDEEIVAAMKRDNGRGRVYEEYRHSQKGIVVGEQFLVLDHVTSLILNFCIQCGSADHMSFFCKDHPHPIVRSYNRGDYPYDKVEVIEEMMLMLRSYELMGWAKRLAIEGITKHKGLIEEVYDFCLDCDFDENPLFLDYDMRPTATSQVTIS